MLDRLPAYDSLKEILRFSIFNHTQDVNAYITLRPSRSNNEAISLKYGHNIMQIHNIVMCTNKLIENIPHIQFGKSKSHILFSYSGWVGSYWARKRFSPADIKCHPTNLGRGQIRARAAFPGKFWPDQKTGARPAQLQKKNITLAFLKAAWLQIPHWVPFTVKSKNPIYMCTSKS